VTDLAVVRWTRYGKDRLYVNGPGGSRVGWLDLQSGVSTVAEPNQRQAFDAAVAKWFADTAVPVWHDLSLHRPGQGVRERAAHELADMKEQSRLKTFIARAADMKTEERAWRLGADGEETVGGRLEKLTGHGWHLLHSVPVGSRGADIDHVLIGPGGVYTVNTKNHPGRHIWVGAHAIRVDGRATDYLPKSRHEAKRAEKLLFDATGLPVPVRPVLVFLTGSLIPTITIKQQPADVSVLDRMDIPGAFRRAPRRMEPAAVASLLDAARRCTTWTPSGTCPCAATSHAHATARG